MDELFLEGVLASDLTASHSEKEGAAPTWKRGFGFHPLLYHRDGPRGETLREAILGLP